MFCKHLNRKCQLNKINNHIIVLALPLVMFSIGRAQTNRSAEKINLSGLESPIVLRGDENTAYRDPAAVYHDGVFFLYFTMVRMEEEGRIYSYTALSRSSNLRNWSEPVIITPKGQRLNYCSPGNVIRYGDEWILCLQTYPRPNYKQGDPVRFGDRTARLFIMRSPDLVHWSEPELLRVKSSDVPMDQMGRMIDPYLIEDRDEPGKWWCFYKQQGVSMSWSRDLKTWTYAGRTPGGENVCVIPDGDQYVMFCSAGNGMAVKRSKNLKDWCDTNEVITLGQAKWSWAQGRLTAGFVLDLRQDSRVGKALMFFHGSDFPEQDPRGGFDTFASLGLAWSDDLTDWHWPGKRTDMAENQ